jgi:hypothetical protein
MVEIFPEIETFFEQKQFTQEQLDALKELMESKYQDDHARKLAASAINIKLLQYQLSGPMVARINEKIRAKLRSKKENSSTSKNTQSKTGLKRAKRKVQKLINKAKLTPVESFHKKYINKPLYEVSSYLKMPTNLFISDLNKREGTILKQNTKFSEEIWQDNKDLIEKRLISKKRTPKGTNSKIIKKSRPSNKPSPGVYGKLVKAKTIGSLIYTRMS